jgi:hypothetical protein
MTTIEEGRGAIKKRTAQIKKRTARRLETKVSMMGVEDNGASCGQRRREQGRTQQPTIDGIGNGKQWLAMMRVRGQRLATTAEGGVGQRRGMSVAKEK